ncbi:MULTISPECIES: acyl-CoA carboxylase subunit epsilon [Glutamicibacter]|uniref:Acyl-CoA carboxylase subunit epsilon n=1 Tax=Glutamicibacter halophytocola TaxID=1933880 RepID=A0A5B8IPK2_9MICC|nr:MULTISPECIES: acyl-CoA carboxylase subunit epsilon [Glutamicibacter]MBF6671283.1 acyl-CoA carboxylase subunit epsilon [Glutamicibacter sp. FBE19]NQD39410.1 acyl-CoA carboxylase subunit epsilon [Glutamicibacter halophytocola]QDY67614.1 acyl-CoA carboxylase subunit epsilon [Glutamicibacter halophytocola]UUX59797.1 acyl-CoA carboxylase subunit epsilon [Glutamicibacter halophytocola]
MEQDTATPAAPQIQVTKGNPSAEELAAVTALLCALGNAPAEQPDEAAPAKKRVTRLRKRRALTPRLGWTVGRR